MLIHPIFASYFERLTPENIYLFVGTASFDTRDIQVSGIDTNRFFDARLVCDDNRLGFEFFGKTCSTDAESVKEAMMSKTWKQYVLSFEKDCKASFLNESNGVITLLFFGLGKTSVCEKFKNSGDAWFETNKKNDIVAGDAPCIATGESVDSLLRIPVWKNPYLSNELVSIEPVTFEFLKTVTLANSLFIRVMLGELTALDAIQKMVQAGIKADVAVTSLDQYTRDENFAKYLVSRHKHRCRPYGNRFSTKSECEERDQCARTAIDATSGPEYQNLNFVPSNGFRVVAVAAKLI